LIDAHHLKINVNSDKKSATFLILVLAEKLKVTTKLSGQTGNEYECSYLLTFIVIISSNIKEF
jgi:hypothetical protein